MAKSNKMAHFFRSDWGSKCVSKGVLGVYEVYKSGLRILIQAPKVQFLVPPKWLKLGRFSHFRGTKKAL